MLPTSLHQLITNHQIAIATVMKSTFLFPFVILVCCGLTILAAQTTDSIYPKAAQPTMSGYLPINANTDTTSALFFAYYEARESPVPTADTPLLLWLQGGPGCSSMLGNLFELGPWLVSADSPSLRYNPASWNRLFGLLFIDNPIGSGFSVASDPSEIPKNQSTVAEHLWFAMQSFLSLNSSFRSRPLYLTGESYAGKYIPATGYYILQQNSQVTKSKRINLSGIAIGNGLTHPIAQVGTHALSGYFSGLINGKQKADLEALQDKSIQLTLQEKWTEASDARSSVLELLQNVTGLVTLYDLTKIKPYDIGLVGVFLNRNEVKAALGVAKGVTFEECSGIVAEAMEEDIMKSVKFMVEELIKTSRVLLYQGIYDVQDGVVSNEAWINELKWEELESFMIAERKVWNVDGKLAGYVQKWGSLSHVVISGAGHPVPADQGNSSQAMIEDWVLQRNLFNSSGKKSSTFRRSH